MRSPFEELGKPRLDDDEMEEIEGSFWCQVPGCYLIQQTAFYIAKIKHVTWKCVNGHVNHVEMDLSD